ncbi:hypothetical protein [Laceyella putida]|uniref:Uncharacterized protein n=1 Tax=Laceyella putida TaxID=110101 RepID=A0ABW2RNS4_9BACL
MVTLKERRMIQFNEENDFSRYCSAIADGFCPFLAPAEQQSVLFASHYRLDGESIFDLQEGMFYVGIVEIERFRRFRKGNIHSQKGILACENVIFELSAKFDDVDGKELFGWPHYLLKVLYTQVGIMLGKFWIKERDVSRDGLPIPEPPCHFLSIRSAVKSRDPFFFTEAPFLMSTLLESKDNGKNVHEFLLQNGCDISSIESMRNHHYYQQVKEWVERKVTARLRRMEDERRLY